MPLEHNENEYAQITLALAQVLSMVRDGLRITAIARRRGVATTTVRTQIGHLEALTGCTSLDELADWWRQHDERLLHWVATFSGVTLTRSPRHNVHADR